MCPRKHTKKYQDEESYRPLCVRCLRASSVCVCEKIKPFETAFQIILLQHPKERKNTIGTARLAHLVLKSSRLIAGVDFENDAEVNAILARPDSHAVTLFPGEGAWPIDENPAAFLASIPTSDSGRAKLVVFVIDGTWSQARGMLRRSPRLFALPRISFSLTERSQYKVRKQPRDFCLSTIEAVARLVKILEPGAPAESLLHPFQEMVDAQFECVTRGRKA